MNTLLLILLIPLLLLLLQAQAATLLPPPSLHQEQEQAVAPPAPPGNGLTFDPCTIDEDCAFGRTCHFLSSDRRITTCNDASGCLCLTPSPVTCTSSSDCDSGERCADVSNIGIICISANAVDDYEFPLVEIPDNTEEASPSGSGKGTGLVLEPCAQNADCLNPRVCFDITKTPDAPCSPTGDGQCVCVYETPEQCESNAQCAPGETCAQLAEQTRLCVSAAVIDAQSAGGVVSQPDSTTDDLNANGDGNGSRDVKEPPKVQGASPTRSPTTSTPTTSTPTTATTNTTITSTDGTAAEEPTTNESDDPPESPEPDEFFSGTISPTTTPDATTSDEPDVTSGIIGDPITTDPFTTDAPLASLEPEEAVCIQEEHLSHLQAHELVFPGHRLARVLCDMQGSCATAGHMVRWRGQAMMMTSYCMEVGCAERVRMVNSPRYRRGLFVRSRSHGLVFTAFAARFATRIEEQVLSGVIRVGL